MILYIYFIIISVINFLIIKEDYTGGNAFAAFGLSVWHPLSLISESLKLHGFVNAGKLISTRILNSCLKENFTLLNTSLLPVSLSVGGTYYYYYYDYY
jgi:outer membrane protein assembly factor BamA